MYRLRKLLCASALATTAATAAIAAPAQAAPDWTAPVDLADPAHVWHSPLLGYAGGGVELGAHLESSSAGGFPDKVVLTRRTAGDDVAEERRIDALTGLNASTIEFDVAANGAAVVAWGERDVQNSAGKQVVRAAYRSPEGTWEAPVTIASDDSATFTGSPTPAAAIGDDGTAVAGGEHNEADVAGEFQPDGRVDVRVHPGGGNWDAGKRLSASEKSGTDLELAVDRAGTPTAAYAERTTERTSPARTDDDSSVHVRRWFPAANGWGGVQDLGSGPGSQASRVNLAVAADGRALLTWQKTFLSGQHFAAVARRDSGNAGFGTPGFVVKDVAHTPLAAGVAPDGTSYLLLADDDPANKGILAVRGKAGADFEPARNVGPVGGTGAIAFRGNDAVLGWTGPSGGSFSPHAALWPATTDAPLAAHVFETRGSAFTQLVSDREGSVVAHWNIGNRPRVSAFDGTAPRPFAASVPRSGEVGVDLTVSAQFADLFSAIDGDPAWDFGDGSTGQGRTLSHTYAAPGDYTVTARGRDALGNERTSSFPVTIAPRPEQGTPTTPADPAGPTGPSNPTDSAAPAVKLKLPPKRLRSRRSAWQTLRGTVADAQPSSGVQRVEVVAFRRGDKRKVRRAALSGSAWKRKLPKLRPGTWTFRVRAIDNAGHASKTIRKTVKLPR